MQGTRKTETEVNRQLQLNLKSVMMEACSGNYIKNCRFSTAFLTETCCGGLKKKKDTKLCHSSHQNVWRAAPAPWNWAGLWLLWPIPYSSGWIIKGVPCSLELLHLEPNSTPWEVWLPWDSHVVRKPGHTERPCAGTVGSPNPYPITAQVPLRNK